MGCVLLAPSENDRNFFWLRVGDPLDDHAVIRNYFMAFEFNQSQRRRRVQAAQ
jgi:hypothetical protein